MAGPMPETPQRSSPPIDDPGRSASPSPAFDAAAASRRAVSRQLREHLEACLADLANTSARLRSAEHATDIAARLGALRAVLADGVAAAETDLGLARRLVEALGAGGLPEARGVDLAAHFTPSDVVGGNVMRVLRVDDGNLMSRLR